MRTEGTEIAPRSPDSPTSVWFAVRVPDAAAAEHASAEAWAAGAQGIEEIEEPAKVLLKVYAARAEGPRVASAIAGALGERARIGPLQPVPDVDWSRAWSRGLEAVVVSERLAVRPSPVAHAPAPGQRVLVVDPAQAFGTGHHGSTRLALELLDAEREACARSRCVLDVGTGTGVLALAAVVLGARCAVGFDLDPVATRTALANARRNGLAERTAFFTGPLDAVGPGPFDLVVANLLRRELVPLLPGIAARLGPGGVALFSGLLAAERASLDATLAAVGLAVSEARTLEDERGDCWLALATRRG